MGRLINADALAEGYKHMGYDPTEHPEESYLEGWCKGFNAAVDHCMYHVIHAPTIEERKTGKWVHLGGDEWCCDKCGFVITTEGSWEHPHDIGANYCQNCGAKMEG